LPKVWEEVISVWKLNLLDQPNRLWYAIRMPGGEGGLLSDGESYPYMPYCTSAISPKC